MASTTSIRLASRTYDGILPILRGQMQVPGFDLHITETSDVAGMFAGMFKGHYDVGEMSLGELIYYTSRSKAEFIGLSLQNVSAWIYILPPLCRGEQSR
jgi:hypothetical protein